MGQKTGPSLAVVDLDGCFRLESGLKFRGGGDVSELVALGMRQEMH
jgi:hypothetical protein